MAKTQTVLRLRIQQAGKVTQRYLMAHEHFTVGRSSENDLVLFGESYPKQHVLVAQNNNATYLHIPAFGDGEFWMNNSKLTLQDLKTHRLLPVHAGSFIFPLFEGKEGYLNLGNNVRIDFDYTTITITEETYLQPFDGFTWHKVFIRDLTKDLYFKLIFLSFLIVNSLILLAYKDIKIEKKQEDLKTQTQRLIKISMKILPQKEIESNFKRMTSESTETEKDDNNQSQRESGARERRTRKSGEAGRGNPNADGGLLGLIAGSGASNQGSSVLDFLVDKGLTADLNRAMGGGSNLKVGSGGVGSNSADILSGLIGTGGGTGGIDDLINDYVDDEVEVVKLTKKSQIKIDQKAAQSSISQEAQGYRTQESIFQVVMRVQGRLQYIYEKYLKRDVNFKAKVTIEFTVDASGKVSNARIRESTSGNSEFDQEILQAIRRLSFPAIPEGNASFVFPFVFQRIE
ncbi:TonB family protein [candidate division KSB1 bacterium]|nr:TonB family protein [candidate division KSB1 bacterium]